MSYYFTKFVTWVLLWITTTNFNQTLSVLNFKFEATRTLTNKERKMRNCVMGTTNKKSCKQKKVEVLNEYGGKTSKEVDQVCQQNCWFSSKTIQMNRRLLTVSFFWYPTNHWWSPKESIQLCFQPRKQFESLLACSHPHKPNHSKCKKLD